MTFILLSFIVSACKNIRVNQTSLYVAKKHTLVLLEHDGILKGYSLNPHYTPYNCNIFFKGKVSNSYDTAKVYFKSGDSLYQIDNEVYGYFIYKKDGNKLLVKYKTKLIGCADWIFPNSNYENSIDTITFKEIEGYSNPKIACLKEDNNSQYQYLHNYFIIYNSNSANVLNFRWIQSVFQKEELIVDFDNCVIF